MSLWYRIHGLVTLVVTDYVTTVDLAVSLGLTSAPGQSHLKRKQLHIFIVKVITFIIHHSILILNQRLFLYILTYIYIYI